MDTGIMGDMMMTVFAMIFPLALIMALGTIAVMMQGYGRKLIAALRMEPYVEPNPAPRSFVRVMPVTLATQATPSIGQKHVLLTA